ncbi:Cell division protein SepF [Corynebacterium capitovis DSM 44611]|uniref:cell division protein SepF n=1 Tax=Corynebacterium capitovis TaxID=131081 RepID=UPI0003748C01|nr:cell division protein SepF [Corynebacterium capitovis]WKD57372.1 Cell division protein SepF [Corynebacterium capitovis DSM 44611]
MSLFGSAKEFFGLDAQGVDVKDAYNDSYYDEPQYADHGSAAYTRETPREAAPERYSYRETAPRSYEPAIVTTEPRGYSDAKEIGEPFRDGDAVIMELTGVDATDAKRLVDFAAGLCFALRGTMHKLSKGVDTDRLVFAIVPESARIAPTELQRAAHLR